MKKKVLIPNRGTVALDIIQSLSSMGLETILLYSPEDAHSLPVKLADRSYKFYSSRLEDSYLDMDSIMEMARELQVDYIHPGYGFLSENPEFARRCRDSNITFIGPDVATLRLCRNKIETKNLARRLGIATLRQSELINSPLDIEFISPEIKFPVIIKPLNGTGGQQIRVAEFRRDAQDKLQELLKRESNQKQGLFIEEFLPYAHHIEIPFLRDIKGNIIFLPEIESSVQRRFQKIFQESPSPNISDDIRESMYQDSRKIIEEMNYVGLGYTEFIVSEETPYFLEINPTLQINTLIPEVHQSANFIKKQFILANGELLHEVHGIKTVKPRYNVLLLSVNAENPDDGFTPSAGTVREFFHYATIRNVFKTGLFTGADISSTYDPNIGKILSYAVQRVNAIRDLRQSLDTIKLRGVHTNLTFLKNLLDSKALVQGKTNIDFLNLRYDTARKQHSEEELEIAAALLSSAFHLENRRKNYKAELERMKQPGFLRRIFSKR